jgi:two-component system, NtrC family, sensor histidine kinase HydH
MFFGGLHAAAWFRYSAALDGRGLTRFERAVVGGGVALSLLALVPGLFLESTVLPREIPWLGVTYRDGTPTAVGHLAFTYHASALLFLLGRHVRRWRQRKQDAGAYALALAAMAFGAAHDSFATSGLLSTPYILDVAMSVLVLVVGAAVTKRFVADAHVLELSARRLAAAQAELVKREKLAAVGELAAVIAHEVRNPLAVFFNALSSLRKPIASAERESLLGILEEEAERLRTIVAELLDFARPRVPILAPTCLAATVKSAVGAACREAEALRDDVVLETVEAPPQVVCDEQLLRQAVINLVTNALKAEGRRSAVQVTVRQDSGATEIVVADDGNGVSPELRPQIFTPFFSTRPTGTGLGLSVVQQSAEAHGGNVTVSTTPGGGATFTMRLPLQALSPSDA